MADFSNISRTGAVGITVLIWGMLFVWQGLDFTDTGFSLTAYQQFYSSPESIRSMMGGFWLSLFIGHWLGALFGEVLLSYNIAGVVVFACTAMAAYAGLAAIRGHSWALAALVFVAFLVIRRHVVVYPSYSNITALFFAFGGAFIAVGLIRSNKWLVFYSGLCFGASIFVRLPNVLAVLLVSLVWVHAWLNQWRLNRTIKWSTCFFGGYVVGTGFIFLMIALHGHYHLYIQSIMEMLGMASDPISHHSSTALIKLFVTDHIKAFTYAVVIILSGALLAKWFSGKQQWVQITLIVVCTVVVTLRFRNYTFWMHALPGLLYIGLGAIIWVERHRNKPMVLMAWLALLLMILAPLGSAAGIHKAVYGMWIAFPLVIGWLWSTSTILQYRFFETSSAKVFVLGLLSIIGLNALSASWHFVYGDNNHRINLTHTLSEPLLFGIHTTKERAQLSDEMLAEIHKIVAPGNDLLTYGDIPLVHFLTNTKPWLGTPWVSLYRGDGGLKISSILAEKEKDVLPVAVRAKYSPRSKTWTKGKFLNFPPDKNEVFHILDDFLEKNGYQLVWSNGFFEILCPKDCL